MSKIINEKIFGIDEPVFKFMETSSRIDVSFVILFPEARFVEPRKIRKYIPSRSQTDFEIHENRNRFLN